MYYCKKDPSNTQRCLLLDRLIAVQTIDLSDLSIAQRD